VGLNLPNPYWTLLTPLATIVGMYTNVPEHGSIDSNQQQWLTNEFATAEKKLPLIVALHHPVYSFDVFHSGSSKMSDALENAIRIPGESRTWFFPATSTTTSELRRPSRRAGPPFIVAGTGIP